MAERYIPKRYWRTVCWVITAGLSAMDPWIGLPIAVFFGIIEGVELASRSP